MNIKLEPPVPAEPNVVIELTPYEAKLLKTLCGSLIGSGKIRADLTSKIWAKLDNLGVKSGEQLVKLVDIGQSETKPLIGY